jgi:hypothetical protein
VWKVDPKPAFLLGCEAAVTLNQIGHGQLINDLDWNPLVIEVNDLEDRVTAVETLDRDAKKFVPSGTTTSGSYANVPSSTVASITKSAASTVLVVTLIGEVFNATGSTTATLAVLVAGTDYEVVVRALAQTNVRQELSGTIDIPGISAGAVTVTARWKTSGGTLTANTNSWTMRVDERI